MGPRLAAMVANKEKFMLQYGSVGAVVLEIFNTVDPYGIYEGDKNPDEYVDYSSGYLDGRSLDEMFDFSVTITGRIEELKKQLDKLEGVIVR